MESQANTTRLCAHLFARSAAWALQSLWHRDRTEKRGAFVIEVSNGLRPLNPF
jgi:hypothetical protein